MVDASLQPTALATICRQHVKIVFKVKKKSEMHDIVKCLLQNLNIANGGRINKDEFMQRCRADTEIVNTLEVFNSFSTGLLNF